MNRQQPVPTLAQRRALAAYLHNRTGADAYNAVCNLERRHNNEQQPPAVRDPLLAIAFIAIASMATTWFALIGLDWLRGIINAYWGTP